MMKLKKLVYDLEKRFGIVAVEKDFITADQFVDALRIQVMEEIEEGKHRLVGAILLEQGFIGHSELEEVLAFLKEFGSGIKSH